MKPEKIIRRGKPESPLKQDLPFLVLTGLLLGAAYYTLGRSSSQEICPVLVSGNNSTTYQCPNLEKAQDLLTDKDPLDRSNSNIVPQRAGIYEVTIPNDIPSD
jgi:hypothetical protein